MKNLPLLCFLTLSALAQTQEPVTLNQAISAARANRPAFESARLRVAQAQLSRRALGAFPTTRLLVGYTSDQEVGGSDEDLVLSQPIDIFGRVSAARASGSALIGQAEAELVSVAAEIQAEVVTAYVEAATSAEFVKTAASIQDTFQRLYDATQLRVEGGAAAGVQLTRVGLELDQAKLRTRLRRSELQANLQRLASLIGATDTVSISTGMPDLPLPETTEAAVVRQRADLLLLAADVRSAEADARVARLGSMPELEIQGRRSPWQQTDQRYGLRLQLAIPLIDYGKARAETKAASTRADAARRSLEDRTRMALGEIAALKTELEAIQAQVRDYETLVLTAQQLVERLRPALTEQATTLLEVLDATRALRDVEEGLVEARQRLAQAQARLLRATGQMIEVAP